MIVLMGPAVDFLDWQEVSGECLISFIYASRSEKKHDIYYNL